VMVLDVACVELQDQDAVGAELLVLVAAVGRDDAEDALVPVGGAADVGDGDEGLGPDGSGHAGTLRRLPAAGLGRIRASAEDD
jgi:hypothetical protein